MLLETEPRNKHMFKVNGINNKNFLKYTQSKQ